MVDEDQLRVIDGAVDNLAGSRPIFAVVEMRYFAGLLSVAEVSEVTGRSSAHDRARVGEKRARSCAS